MQTYGCNHCGESFMVQFETFLHIFCTHLHKDIALAPIESQRLLAGTMKYTRDMIAKQGGN